MSTAACCPSPARPALSTALARLALALGFAALAGCSTAPQWDTTRGLAELVAQQAAKPAESPTAALPRLAANAPRPPYRIGPGDELAITIWGPREVWQDVVAQTGTVSRNVTVQDDGTIILPLVRRVNVAGQTMGEVLARLGESYRGVAGARFQVDGSVARARSQTVLVEGAVVRPGQVVLGGEIATLGEAVTGAAGGLAEAADGTRGLLLRGGERYPIDWQAAQEGGNDHHRIALQPGDRIYFPLRRAGSFYVFGEVSQPGVYPIPPQGVTLLQALAQAKGPLVPLADQRTLVLVRAGEGGAPAGIYSFSLEEALAAPELVLAPGDRLYVPATGLTNWERTIRQVIPMLGGMSAPR